MTDTIFFPINVEGKIRVRYVAKESMQYRVMYSKVSIKRPVLLKDLVWIFSDSLFQTTRPKRIYNPITAMGFLAMFMFQLDSTKR